MEFPYRSTATLVVVERQESGDEPLEQAIADAAATERAFRDDLDERDERLDDEAEDAHPSSDLGALAKDAVARAAMLRFRRSQ